jgi:hypothetical protein
MLHDDLIRPSQSPWASPVIFVAKKDASKRFYADYVMPFGLSNAPVFAGLKWRICLP